MTDLTCFTSSHKITLRKSKLPLQNLGVKHSKRINCRDNGKGMVKLHCGLTFVVWHRTTYKITAIESVFILAQTVSCGRLTISAPRFFRVNLDRPSPPGTFHILIGKFSYFIIRFLNQIFLSLPITKAM